MTSERDYMTIGEAAERIGIRQWKLGRLYERGLLPRPPKLGPYRVVRESDLPAIVEAARKVGYLSGEGVAH